MNAEVKQYVAEVKVNKSRRHSPSISYASPSVRACALDVFLFPTIAIIGKFSCLKMGRRVDERVEAPFYGVH